jgi:hypothetical protein
MFSNLWAVTSLISFAQKNDRVPVVDFRTSRPMNRIVGKEDSDAWRDYFEPISPASLDEALASDDVVFVKGRTNEFPVHEYSQDPRYQELFAQHIRLNPTMQAYVDLWKSFLEGSGPVLGVHARGTDMRVAKSHLAPPEGHQISQMIDRALKAAEFTSIFVASEDQDALKRLVRRYGTMIVTTDSFRTSERSKLSRMKSNVLEWRYVLGMQVLRDTWLLGACDGLVSGSSNVSEHAQVIKGSPYTVNYQIRRPRVDVIGSSSLAIKFSNLARYWTTSRVIGADFKVIDRSL